MSDDIVADLRSYTERFELSPRIQGKLMLEAADEIERLREGRDTMGNLWAKEKAENERLQLDLRAKQNEVDTCRELRKFDAAEIEKLRR